MAQDYLEVYARLIGARADRKEDRSRSHVVASRSADVSSPQAISEIAAFTRPAASAQHRSKA
jgi:hypothetical protein